MESDDRFSCDTKPDNLEPDIFSIRRSTELHFSAYAELCWHFNLVGRMYHLGLSYSVITCLLIVHSSSAQSCAVSFDVTQWTIDIIFVQI